MTRIVIHKRAHEMQGQSIQHSLIQRLKSRSKGRTSLCAIAVVAVMTYTVFAQRLPIPGAPKQPASTLIEAIDKTRNAYQIELLAISTYEAALNTPYLKGETKTL